jgi:hypothetical protein
MFMNILLYIFAMHGIYIRLIFLIAGVFYILDVNLVNATFNSLPVRTQIMEKEYRAPIVFPFLISLWLVYIIVWVINLYWEEKARKLEFWYGYKKVKEYQKL